MFMGVLGGNSGNTGNSFDIKELFLLPPVTSSGNK